ncbi:hypothetical protein CEP52_011865 [Fusarium oligoseptatum]|uniref:F-box domain-containing protein n=1 Tax=Fusarium oligoseptatum TaxID=2604345 RepID=A0A428T155_9HYPO|nr:hypothetical protein CEP52_011865 [Fusarium oligoseptatum]
MEQDWQVPPKFRNEAYYLRANDHTLSDNLPPLRPKPENGRSHIPPATDLGAFDALSIELLSMILAEIDLQTLVNFRLVNRRAAEVVDQVPPYKAVITHALHALRGILSIEAGKWITCRTLYEKLCQAGCEVCSDFGGYLYLITCTRVCFLCLSRDKRYLPVTPQQAWREFGLSSDIVDTLPRMRVVPGTYSLNEQKAVRSILVDYQSCLDTGLALHGSFTAMRKYASDIDTRNLPPLWELLQQRGASRIQPLRAAPIDGHDRNPLRFVAITHMPWLNKETKQLEWGFHCVGCEGRTRAPYHYRRKFTADSFRVHLEQCSEIQDRKHVRDMVDENGARGLLDNVDGPVALVPVRRLHLQGG